MVNSLGDYVEKEPVRNRAIWEEEINRAKTYANVGASAVLIALSETTDSALVTEAKRLEALSETVVSAGFLEGDTPEDTEEFIYLLGLTPKESEVMDLVAEGKSNREVSRSLGMQESTVKFHLAHIYAKLPAENRTAAAHKWREYKALYGRQISSVGLHLKKDNGELMTIWGGMQDKLKFAALLFTLTHELLDSLKSEAGEPSEPKP